MLRSSVVGDLPLDGHGGETLYDKIGDVFGWLCLVAGIALTGLALSVRLYGAPSRPVYQQQRT